jgi:hypothetical protein
MPKTKKAPMGAFFVSLSRNEGLELECRGMRFPLAGMEL